MDTQLNAYTVKDLESRFHVARSNIYKRIDGLRAKGYPMEPEKLDGKSYYSLEQVAVMDALDQLLSRGASISEFPSMGGESLSYSPTRQSHETRDNSSLIDLTPNASAALGMASLIDSIVTRIVDVYPAQPDPLDNLRRLQEVCDRGWLLSSSQLAPLVGRKSLPSADFDRYGFRFVRVGKNGAETAWKVLRNEATNLSSSS